MPLAPQSAGSAEGFGVGRDRESSKGRRYLSVLGLCFALLLAACSAPGTAKTHSPVGHIASRAPATSSPRLGVEVMSSYEMLRTEKARFVLGS